MFRTMMAGLLMASVAAFAEPVVFYVAPGGNDAWSGKLAAPNADKTDGPLATLAGARDAVRKLKAGGPLDKPVQVQLRAGTYSLTEPFVLGPEDSGTVAAPITYMAYPGEVPVISGGRKITGWHKEGDLWTADLPDVKSGQWYFSALWINGERRTLARTPNTGFLHTAGKVADKPKTAFEYSPGDLKPWPNLDDAIVVVIHSWATSQHRIADLDEAKHVVTFTGPAVWPFSQWEPHQRYYVENVFEALDDPGEWYLNRKTGVLYYKAKPGEEMDKVEAIAPVAPQLLVLNGVPAEGKFVDFVQFNGLNFAHTEFTIPAKGLSDGQAAASLPGAIQAIGARWCAFEGCNLSNVGTYGLWLRAGCKDNLVRNNKLWDLGAGGIRIGEQGDAPSENEAALRNWVDNNRIEDGGKTFLAGCGVWIGKSSYNTVSHNEIAQLGYTGVSVGWSWGYAPSSANHNIIEYNHIHHIGMQEILSDMGGVYLLGVAPGTIVRHNHIHDVSSFLYGGWGIYPDEGSTDLLIENNVVHDTRTGGFHQHYGKENRVINNIFAFSKEDQLMRTREEDHLSFFFERNIVYFTNARLLGSNWKNNRFLMDNNCYWSTAGDFKFAGFTFPEWQARGQDIGSIIADPLFVDPDHRDFRLKPESPALKLGFRPINVEEAGVQSKSLPK